MNGVLIVMGEGQIRIHSIIQKLRFKEFLSSFVKTFYGVYMVINNEKKPFEALGNIVEKIDCFLPSSMIMD